MLHRTQQLRLEELLGFFPVVALVGPRQVGKTTLARTIEQKYPESIFLDLERPADMARLQNAEAYLKTCRGRLCVIDEVQRQGDVCMLLRAEVDARKQAGEKSGQFLLLGSASRDLLQQCNETLAGRIAVMELYPLTVEEAAPAGVSLEDVWLRGGFPDSLLAATDAWSHEWRMQFIASFLERDLPQLGFRLPAARMRRFWSMLAYQQGSQLNASRLGSGLDLSGSAIRHQLDVLEDCFMLRQLLPWSGNSAKRLVKSPKVYVRDSGLCHALADITSVDMLYGHPLCGPSWEGFIIEQIMTAIAAQPWNASYYRSSAGAEVDLILERQDKRIAIEIKRTLSPRPSKGFYLACDDMQATHRWFVCAGTESFPLRHGVEALSLADAIHALRSM